MIWNVSGANVIDDLECVWLQMCMLRKWDNGGAVTWKWCGVAIAMCGKELLFRRPRDLGFGRIFMLFKSLDLIMMHFIES
jgi:hypothetical protein